MLYKNLNKEFKKFHLIYFISLIYYIFLTFYKPFQKIIKN